MTTAHFELKVSVPAEARFAETIRDLAAHAARYAGCGENDADRYGRAVRTVLLECLARPAARQDMPVIFRRGGGPVECLIGCEGGFDPAADERDITVGWTREQGTTMCRIALELS
jgi:hypothetical protein